MGKDKQEVIMRKMATLGIGSFVIMFIVKAAIVWGIISLATSGIKTHTGDCDKRYQIEKFVNGSLFCKDKK